MKKYTVNYKCMMRILILIFLVFSSYFAEGNTPSVTCLGKKNIGSDSFPVYKHTLSPGGKYLVAGNAELQLFDIYTGQAKWNNVISCSKYKFSPSGDDVVVFVRNYELQLSEVQLFSTKTGKLRWKKQIGLNDLIDDFKFSSDGKYLVLAFVEEVDKFFNKFVQLQLLDSQTGKSKWKNRLKKVSGYNFSSNGDCLLVECNMNLGLDFEDKKFKNWTVQLFNSKTGCPKWKTPKYFCNLKGFGKLSPSGKYFIFQVGYKKPLQLFDTKTGKRKWIIKNKVDDIISIDFSSNDEYLTVLFKYSVTDKYNQKKDCYNLQLYHANSGKPKWKNKKNYSYSFHKFSSDNKYLVVRSRLDSVLRLYDVKTGLLKWQINDVYSFVFSPKGRYLLVNHKDKALQLYYANTAKLIWRTSKYFNNSIGICNRLGGRFKFSPNGDYVVVKFDKCDLQMFEAKTGKVVWSASKLLYYLDRNLVFAPNDKYFVVKFGDKYNKTLQLFDTETGQPQVKTIHNILDFEFHKNKGGSTKLFVFVSNHKKSLNEIEVQTYLLSDK